MNRRFAPHVNSFRHHAGLDAVDQVHFAADKGFVAFEDCGIRAKSAGEQTRIGDALARRGMAMGAVPGVIEFGKPIFALRGTDSHRHVLDELRTACDVASRVGARSVIVVPGVVPRGETLPMAWRSAVDLLRSAEEFVARRNFDLILEPIDHRRTESRLLLQSPEQAASMARTVGGRCRVLLDVYQVAMSGGDASQTVRDVGDVLGYVQLADGPGRKEPGTGAIDFRSIFAALDEVGYRGVLAMEHGQSLPGIEGERAVLESYRRLSYAANIFATICWK